MIRTEYLCDNLMIFYINDIDACEDLNQKDMELFWGNQFMDPGWLP